MEEIIQAFIADLEKTLICPGEVTENQIRNWYRRNTTQFQVSENFGAVVQAIRDWAHHQHLIDEEFITAGKKSFPYLFRQIAENFDFEKVFTVMKATNWGWAVNGSEYTYIPTVDAIKESVLDKCRRVYAEESTIGSGGFWVSYDKEDGILIVQFIAVDWVAE